MSNSVEQSPRDRDTSFAGMDAQAKASFAGLGNLVDSIAPWLIDLGSWIFGGLIAFGLVVIAALITVGPVDTAILIGVTALAAALPLNLGGILLLRLIKDTKELRFGDLTLQAFQRGGFPNIETYFPAATDDVSLQRRGALIAISCCWAMLVLSGILTLAGLVAALWHMAWWTCIALIAAIALSAVLVTLAMANALPPASDAERGLGHPAAPQRTKQGPAQTET